MVNYARPGVTGKMIAAACNIRALHNYIRNHRFVEDRTGEPPTRGEINYLLQMARKADPRFEEQRFHDRLMAHLRRWDEMQKEDVPLPPPFLSQKD